MLAAVASILLYSVMLWHTLAPPPTSTHTHALFKLQCGGNWCVTQSARQLAAKSFSHGGVLTLDIHENRHPDDYDQHQSHHSHHCHSEGEDFDDHYPDD